MTETEKQFKAFADGLQLRHISWRELLVKTANPGNTLPPKSKWLNIVRPAILVDMARAHFGVPVTLHSTYRSPEYNRSVGGASNSRHLEFNAIDCSLQGVSPQRLYNMLLALRQGGAFKGGLGLYSSFVHIDERGSNATWKG